MLGGCYHGCSRRSCRTPYLAKDLADLRACDEVTAGAYDGLRRLHVISRGGMGETHLHVRCKGYWPCCLQTSSVALREHMSGDVCRYETTRLSTP